MDYVAIVNLIRNIYHTHDGNHTVEEIGVQDQTLIVLPGNASIVLRRRRLGFTIDDDQMRTAAQSLLPLPDEEAFESDFDRLHYRFQCMDYQFAKMPQHFVLNDKIWPL